MLITRLKIHLAPIRHRSDLIFAALIAAIAFGYFVLHMDGILAFWLAYILTRPLGASIGDLFSQPPEYGGLGFGATDTSILFFACIAAVVVYMTVQRDKEYAEADDIS